ncbi:MAG: hypothetical protein IJM49_05950 [Firmicutes bacterium]|jgi:DNA-directed RNA polymerase subunit RPC12/RpoP|nr:hypothetical protein [Bacillota bacterium]MBR0482059.1 hypothetical protein [Bacillota bacterium]
MGLVTEYKCPGCGAPLAFDAASGQVTCEHCGNTYSVAQIVSSQKPETTAEEFDWGNYKAGLSTEVLDNTVVYQCQSCGAILETDSTTAATSCPYCDNNIVINDRVSAGYKPNAVVPFEIDKRQLKEIVHNFYRGRKLLPRNFFNDSYIDRILGVYIPFWLFDCTVEGEVDFRGETVSRTESSRETIITTRDYLLQRSGSMGFTNVPVDGSTKMDDDVMDSIEPYDFSKMVPFNGAYLAGYMADRFDSDPDKELPRVNSRVINSTMAGMESTVSEFSSVSEYSNTLRLRDPRVKYVLLPAYIINCEYRGQKYQYVINGQTGKIVGDLPSSSAVARGYFFKAFAIAVAAFIALFQFIG